MNPEGVQRDTVPHFKGLIKPEWKQIRPRVWQHFYSLPQPFENGYFTSKTAKCPGIKVLKCIYLSTRKCPLASFSCAGLNGKIKNLIFGLLGGGGSWAILGTAMGNCWAQIGNCLILTLEDK